jgi:hypothetical protein
VSFTIIQRAIMGFQSGGWTDFDMHDPLLRILTFLFFGTVSLGVPLLPLRFLTRHVLRAIHTRYPA